MRLGDKHLAALSQARRTQQARQLEVFLSRFVDPAATRADLRPVVERALDLSEAQPPLDPGRRARLAHLLWAGRAALGPAWMDDAESAFRAAATPADGLRTLEGDLKGRGVAVEGVAP